MEEALTTQITPNRVNEEIDKILRNVLQKCKIEAETNMLQVPLKDIEERVAYYTGVSKVKIKQIQNKSAKKIKAQSIDYRLLTQILKCLYQFYLRKELPTFHDLFQEVQTFMQCSADTAVKNYEQFKEDLKLWGFDYHTIFSDTKLLMEDPKITFQRYSYLKKIRQIRSEGALVYYVSAKIIDKDRNFNAPWYQNIEPSENSNGEYTFFHAISNIGFTNGLFNYTATEHDFYKWVASILLGSLRASSVVVLESSPLNGTSESKPISIYDTKQDMQKWLQSHNVPCSNAMNKSQLYELIKKHAVVDEKSRIDLAIRACGHEVLILPPYLEDLSPVQFLWRDIKKSQLPSKDIHDYIIDFFEKLPKKNYQLIENYTKDRENELITLEKDMDKALDAFILDLKNRENVSIKTK